MEPLFITHNAGFFSCCSVKLAQIIDYFNKHKHFPQVDSSKQFELYKNTDSDITYDYFKDYNSIDIELPQTVNTSFHWDFQFVPYYNLDYCNIKPFMQKYFSPSNEINELVHKFQYKYNLQYDNICTIFFRGNDKCTETNLSNYDEYLIYANRILKQNPNILFLIQSDETEFIEFMLEQFPNNSFYFKDEIRHVRKCNNTVDRLLRSQNYDFSKYYLAITIIMSKCKYIICGSGNCSMWIVLFRENANNIYQHLHRTHESESKWYEYETI
jgi:hypothetical protein